MVHKADALYNRNATNLSQKTNFTRKANVCPSNSSLNHEYVHNLSDFKMRNSSTGGKAPCHGPMRFLAPSRHLGDDFVTKNKRFDVSKSEVANYQDIRSLATSSFSRLVSFLFFIIIIIPFLLISFWFYIIFSIFFHNFPHAFVFVVRTQSNLVVLDALFGLLGNHLSQEVALIILSLLHSTTTFFSNLKANPMTQDVTISSPTYL
jgi:hypothetical protein